MAFSRAFSQFLEILLPSNCHRFGSNKLVKTLHRFGRFLLDTSVLIIWHCLPPLPFPPVPLLCLSCPHSSSRPHLLSAPSPSGAVTTACRRAAQAPDPGAAGLQRPGGPRTAKVPAVRRGDVAGSRAEQPEAKALGTAAPGPPRPGRQEVTSLGGVPGAGQSSLPQAQGSARRCLAQPDASRKREAWLPRPGPPWARPGDVTHAVAIGCSRQDFGGCGPSVVFAAWTWAPSCSDQSARPGQRQLRCTPGAHRGRARGVDLAILLPSSLRLDPTPGGLRWAWGAGSNSRDGSLQLAKP